MGLFDKYGHGGLPYEHIPDELTDPRDLLKKLASSDLLHKSREAKKGEKESAKGSPDSDNSEQIKLLLDLAKHLINGTLPPEIEKGSEFYQLLEGLAKQIKMVSGSDLELSTEEFSKKYGVDLGKIEEISNDKD
jgi:hypothetical protein